MTSGASERLRLFRERKRIAGQSALLESAERDWECILVHPFAEEGLPGTSCGEVDCYWRVGSDACFLQVVAAGAAVTDHAIYKSPGLFARWNDWKPPMLNLVGVVGTSQVTRSAFDECVEMFLEVGLETCYRRARRDGVLSRVGPAGT